MLRVAKGFWGGGMGSGGGGGWANSVHVDVPFMWMFQQVLHAPCGEGFLGGGFGGGGLIPFMWMFRSCGFFNRFCMWRRGCGGGVRGGWANSVHVDAPFMWMFRSCGCSVPVDV